MKPLLPGWADRILINLTALAGLGLMGVGLVIVIAKDKVCPKGGVRDGSSHRHSTH